MVYVDEPQHRFGNMIMCHMLADSTSELLAMADKVGVKRKWLQKPGQYGEHFDVCKTKRALAVAAGAKEITQRELGKMLVERRNKCAKN